jgi:thymidine kinase
MIHVFCGRKGSGKTKALIQLANEKVDGTKGNIVYIDNDTKATLELNRKMRLVSTDEFNLKSNNDFYGFLCGMLSRDYDIDTIFVDGVFNIVEDKLEHTAQLFSKMESLAKKYNVEFYVNVGCECINPPEFLKNYIA